MCSRFAFKRYKGTKIQRKKVGSRSEVLFVHSRLYKKLNPDLMKKIPILQKGNIFYNLS